MNVRRDRLQPRSHLRNERLAGVDIARLVTAAIGFEPLTLVVLGNIGQKCSRFGRE